jgi:hypothetical protein
MTFAEGHEFIITPDAGLLLWMLLIPLIVIGGVVTAAKGRFGWLALGLLTGGLIWPLTGLLIATPDSLWARRFYGPERMRRALATFPLRLPHPGSRALR